MKLLMLIITISLLLTNCSKEESLTQTDNSSSPNTADNPTSDNGTADNPTSDNGISSGTNNFLSLGGSVYITGSVEKDNKNFSGYWYASSEGFKRVDLKNARLTYDIAIEGDTVYVVGENTSGKPSLWINNGEPQTLSVPGNRSGWATGLDIHNGDIYISGSYYTNKGIASAYWKNGDFHSLTSNADSEAFDIIFHNNHVITVGWYMSHHVVYACYWKNESRKNLHSSGDGEAYKVVSSGNDFYIAGWTASNKSMANVRATYWKNGGNKKRLSKGTRYQSVGGSESSEARGITVVDGKVYIAGKSDYYNMGLSPAYWKGTTIVEPFKNSDETQDQRVMGIIKGIAVLGDKVLAAGVIDGNLDSYYWEPTKPSLWVDGIRYDLESEGTTSSEVESILAISH
jgi:hypothetical protein